MRQGALAQDVEHGADGARRRDLDAAVPVAQVALGLLRSLDILAWDVFFALSVLFAALVFSGNHLATWNRVLLVASGVLALVLAGLSGIIADDMQLREIGIVGYAGVFPVVALLLVILFHRPTLREA